jgi:hypothetical protein
MPKGWSDTVYRKKENTMADRKGETMIYKTLHRKLKIEQLKAGVNSRVPEWVTFGVICFNVKK